jgi:predicted AAA+ superfamily ATPase
MYQEELLRQGVLPEQIQSYNLEDNENIELRDGDKLYHHIKSKLIPLKKNYVFLDEIQLVSDFGDVANSLYLRGNIDLYITGSNSKTLPIHIANNITREYVTLNIYPLSFKEYYTARKEIDEHINNRDMFDDYLHYSSFPFVFQHYQDKIFNKPKIDEYLNDLLYKIIYRDIAQDELLTDMYRFELVLKFMADNISKETAIKNIANTMTSHGMKTDIKTIESYIQALCDNFLFYPIYDYEIKGKLRLHLQHKYFLVDIGLRYLLLGDKDTDKGKILENVVYLELLRRGNKVYFGKYKGKEIDFVAEKREGLEYYQVAETIRGEETFKREHTPINSIRDHFPKYILTRDYGSSHANGVRIMNVEEWLLQ